MQPWYWETSSNATNRNGRGLSSAFAARRHRTRRADITRRSMPGVRLHAVLPITLGYESMVERAFLPLLRRHPSPQMTGRTQSAVTLRDGASQFGDLFGFWTIGIDDACGSSFHWASLAHGAIGHTSTFGKAMGSASQHLTLGQSLTTERTVFLVNPAGRRHSRPRSSQ
jgi:hypothetical protein